MRIQNSYRAFKRAVVGSDYPGRFDKAVLDCRGIPGRDLCPKDGRWSRLGLLEYKPQLLAGHLACRSGRLFYPDGCRRPFK